MLLTKKHVLFCSFLNIKKQLPSWVYFCVYPIFHWVNIDLQTSKIRGGGGGGRARGEVGAGEKDIKGGWAYKGGRGVLLEVGGGANLLYTMNITHRENLHQPPTSNKLSNLFTRSLSHGFATEEKMGEGNNRDEGRKKKNEQHISNGYFLQKSVASSSLSGKNLFQLACYLYP